MSRAAGCLLTGAEIRLAPAKNEILGALRVGHQWNRQYAANGN